LFEPKIYKSNGLEAYRLLGADGSEFFYEGRVKYDTDQVFKDDQGRAYYHVTTNLGRGMDYYVEVEPEGTPIPMMKNDVAPEKDISGLVVSSPRDNAGTPSKEAFSRPIQAKPAEKATAGPPVFPAEKPSAGFGRSITPETPKEEDTTIEPPSEDEHKHAVEAMGSIKHKKRPLLKLTLAAIAIVIVLVAIAGGIYLYKPDWVRSHVPFLATPTPEPTMTPTITATPVPATPTPEPTVTPGPNLYNDLYAVGAAIHATNQSVVQFSNNHTKTSVGTENNLTYTLDVFDYVNAHWSNATGNATPQNATYLVSVLTGNDRDYSIAICAIAESLGVKSRAVEAFSGDSTIYYPEILVASNNSDFTTVQQYIGSRYGVKDAFAHTDGGEYWLSLARSNAAGLKVNASAEYAVDSSQAITRLS
jgi:hypothetical protein